MTFRFVCLLGLLVAASADAQPVAFDWSRSFGSINNDDGIAVAFDPQGHLLFLGAFRESVDFGGGTLTSAGGEDVFLVKFDPSGLFLWSRQFGGSLDDFAASVAVNSDGDIFVTGSFQGTVDFGGGPLTSAGARDIFVVSLDADGAYRWSSRFGGTADDTASDVAAGSGTVDVVGTFRGTVDFGGGPISSPGASSGFVLRLDTSGVYAWTAVIPGANLGGVLVINQSAMGVAVSESGDAYVVGSFTDCEMLCFYGGFLRKYSPQGNLSWQRTEIGHTDRDNHAWRTASMSDVALGSGGSVFVGGGDFACPDPTRSCGAAVRCYTSAGAMVWERSFSGSPILRGLHTTADGDALITGHFFDTVDFGSGPLTGDGTDIFVARLNGASSTTEWSERIGGSDVDAGMDIAATGEHEFALAGRFRGETMVGEESHTSAGFYDALVVRATDDPPLAVAISEFDARTSNGYILLSARFRSDLGVTSIDVYRSPGAGEFEPVRIASVVDPFADRFEFRDDDVVPGETYRYQIGVHDGDGVFLSAIATVSLPQLRAELLGSQPNPFNPTTMIRLSLPERERVTLVIFDGAGRRVRALLDEARAAGLHSIEWDGRDDAGAVVPSGVYFCRMQSGSVLDSAKLVLLK